MSEQREYNLCPGCGKTSTIYRGGWTHGGISWHQTCEGKPSLATKEGIAAALRAGGGIEVMEAYERLMLNDERQP